MSGVSPFTVAHHVLAAYSELRHKNGWGDMTPLKLIKMVYVAHGYHLALMDGPLLDTDVEAWRYGPVVPEIYFAVKQFVKKDVPADLFVRYAECEDGELSADARAVIERVVEVYGEYDGLDMSKVTHKPGTPWSRLYPKAPGDVMDNNVIQSYYKNLVEA